LEDEFKRQGEKALLYIKRMAISYNKEIETFIKKGRVVNEILKFIKDSNIDLICISHRIRFGSESFRIVSIANQIIEFAQCPVFVLQHK